MNAAPAFMEWQLPGMRRSVVRDTAQIDGERLNEVLFTPD